MKTRDLPSGGEFYHFKTIKIKHVVRQKVRNQPEYVNDEGTVFLKDEYDEIILGIRPEQGLWMMLDIKEYIVHKHGTHDNVKKRFDEFQTKIRAAAKAELDPEKKDFCNQMADDMVMLDISKLPLEELNRVLASSGYIKQVLEKYAIVTAQQIIDIPTQQKEDGSDAFWDQLDK